MNSKQQRRDTDWFKYHLLKMASLCWIDPRRKLGRKRKRHERRQSRRAWFKIPPMPTQITVQVNEVCGLPFLITRSIDGQILSQEVLFGVNKGPSLAKLL